MADILEGCATDPSHQPAIYAAFIREIIRKTREARIRSTYPSRAGSPVPGNGLSGTPITTGLTPAGGAGSGGVDFMNTTAGMLPITNGTIDPNLTGADASAAMQHGGSHSSNGSHGSQAHGQRHGIDGDAADAAMTHAQQTQRGVSFDPMLPTSAWSAGAAHFQFIPQGGDMMYVLPLALVYRETLEAVV
jgi:hypothetical protein